MFLLTFRKKWKIINSILNCIDSCYNENENRGVTQMGKYINHTLEELSKDILVKNDMLKLPVNLIEIANNHNIEVYYVKLPDGISGAIKYNEEYNNYQILIEEREPENRKRFTLAHELAHYFLNDVSKDKLHYDVAYRSQKNEKEKRADYFAGALLMEENIIKKLYRINPSIKELAQVFMVSESAVTVRLMTLGII